MENIKSEIKIVFFISLIIVLTFTFIIWILAPRLAIFPHLPDQGPAWYYWKLPRPEFPARITSWGGYLLHQIFIWFIIVKVVRRRQNSSNSGGLSHLNMAALLGNLIFMLLHLVQTHLFYDGLAQDVPIWSSQYSVIGMLVIILLLLMPRRGLFWGKLKRLPQNVHGFLHRYHGLYISWALVYTFWFHPMEGDYGILLGFLYMFLLFIQMSLFNTSLHTNIYWITLLEIFVALHGTAIAIMNGQSIWPMFLFGFLFLFVFTQMHGFKLPSWIKIIILVVYLGGLAASYYFRGMGKIYELSFIPVTLYGVAGILILLIMAGYKLKNSLKPQRV